MWNLKYGTNDFYKRETDHGHREQTFNYWGSGGKWAGQAVWNSKMCYSFFFFLPFYSYTCGMEVPGLGLKSEPQLLAYAIATAMQDASCICDLYSTLWQPLILNPLSEAKD